MLAEERPAGPGPALPPPWCCACWCSNTFYAGSFADWGREVRESLIYRAFGGLDGERVPDDKTLIRLAQALGPEVWKQKKVYRRLMGTTRAVVREAQKAARQARRPAQKRASRVRQRVQRLAQQTQQMSALTGRVRNRPKPAC